MLLSAIAQRTQWKSDPTVSYRAGRRWWCRAISGSWQTLELQRLNNYERVTGQYAALGLHFENAIALQPSNELFMQRGRQRAIMATGNRPQLKFKLDAAILKLQLAVMGTQPVRLSALDGSGFCIAEGETQGVAADFPQQAHAVVPEQFLSIDAGNVRTLVLTSKAPFLMTWLTVQRRQRLQEATQRTVLALGRH